MEAIGGWKLNSENEPPKNGSDIVEVIYHDGTTDSGPAAGYDFSISFTPKKNRILQWRFLEPDPMPKTIEAIHAEGLDHFEEHHAKTSATLVGYIPEWEETNPILDSNTPNVTEREHSDMSPLADTGKTTPGYLTHPGLAENPKDRVGQTKVPFSALPAPVLGEVGLALAEGARKYGRHNYRVASILASVYYDAAMRHLTAWWEGQDIDPDSGLSHITKAISGLMVLRDCQMTGKVKDDRPPFIHDPAWQDAQADHIKVLIDKYPDPVAPFTCRSS